MRTNHDDRAVYVISVAAELSGLHPQTLRVYERRGLLDPARTGGGSRRYSEADLARLARIAELTEEGINIAGVKRILDLEAEVERLRRQAAELEERARRQVDETHRQYRRDLVPLTQTLAVFTRGPRR
jgi:MerR family transcriptional regulator/heat shock protein HspR